MLVGRCTGVLQSWWNPAVLELVMRFFVPVFSVLLTATPLSAPSVAHAYTLKQTDSGSGVAWHEPRVTVRLDPEVERMVGRGEARAAVRIAVEAWRGLGNSPDLVVSPDPAEPRASWASVGTVGVYVVSPWPYAPGQLAVTVSSFEDGTGRVIDADILLNGEIDFQLYEEHGDDDDDRPGRARGHDRPHPHSPYDLAAVLTHEVGHVLGLGESHDDPDATMWPKIGRGEVHQRSLAVDDEDGVIAAYDGVDVDAASGLGGCSAATAHGTAPSGGLALLFAAIVVLRRRGGRR